MDLLKQDFLKNVSILGFLENYPAEKVYREGSTLLVLGRSDYLWAYVSSSDEGELRLLLDHFRWETGYFASLEEWMLPVLSGYGAIEWQLKTYRYLLPEEVPVSPPEREVRDLEPALAPFIFTHSDYQQYTSEEYIVDRIEKGISAVIMEKGQPVAWGLTHDDGALGFLHVMPEYRGRGYGMDISRALIMKKRKLSKPVFLNIEPENHPSRQLVSRLGFIQDRKISWIKLETPPAPSP